MTRPSPQRRNEKLKPRLANLFYYDQALRNLDARLPGLAAAGVELFPHKVEELALSLERLAVNEANLEAASGLLKYVRGLYADVRAARFSEAAMRVYGQTRRQS